MKFLKIYYYAMQPILILFGLTCLRYFMGDRNIFNTERIFICLIGGLIVGGFWYEMDIYKKRKPKV